MLRIVIISSLFALNFLGARAEAAAATVVPPLYGCEFSGGPLWSAPGTVYKGYIAPAEATAEVSPTIRLDEAKIAAVAYSAQVFGFVSSDGRVGMVLSIYAPGEEEPFDTKVVSDLADPEQQPSLFIMRRVHGVDYYTLNCTPASLAPAK